MGTDNLRFIKEEAIRLAAENDDLRREVQALRRSVRALSALYYASQNITARVDVLRLLGEILDAALDVLKAEEGSLLLTDESTGELVFTVSRGPAANKLEGLRLAPGQGIAGWTAANQQPQIVADVRRDPRFFSGVDDVVGYTTRSLVCVPVTLDDGRVLGVLEVINKLAERDFDQDDVDLLLVVAQLAATAMRRAERAIEGDRPKTGG